MNDKKYDVVVVGATPAGVMAAIAAARQGCSVLLTEYHAHVGGMTTSGLGKSDIENRDALRGLFKEFVDKVHAYYIQEYGSGSENERLCRSGYYYEPSVAERILNQMIEEEELVELKTMYQLAQVESGDRKIVRVGFLDRSTAQLVLATGGIYIDATYEGDLYAKAGVDFRLGRESKEEFGEVHAGRIFFDYNDHCFLSGSTGAGDSHLPAYTYRLCLTDDPGNSFVVRDPPPGYNRNDYVGYLNDLEAGRLSGPKKLKEGHGFYPEHFDTMLRVFSFTRIPNAKYDVNINPRPLGFPFVGENENYVEGSWKDRERIMDRHRNLALGLLYFVQNDAAVPEKDRQMANRYHLPKDEFADNGHFPWQLYVREARRLKGLYTLSEGDLQIEHSNDRSRIFHDSIASGEFPIDSFPVTKVHSEGDKVLEGYISMLEIRPYQIPLRILIPKDFASLIVPVAASTTHVAYSTIRMEPLWMCLGQVAGIVAALSLRSGREPREIDGFLLQKFLLGQDQILTYFEDVEQDDPYFEAIQFWGTRGFFATYRAESKMLLSMADFLSWTSKFYDFLGANSRPQLKELKKNDSISFANFKLWLSDMAQLHGHEINLDSIHLSEEGSGTSNFVSRGQACHSLYHYVQQLQKEQYDLLD